MAISGAHLAGAALTIDRKPITPLAQSDSQVRLQMPEHDNGYAVIAARNTSGTAYGEFLYVPPPLDTLPPGFITTVAGVGAFTRDYGRAR